MIVEGSPHGVLNLRIVREGLDSKAFVTNATAFGLEPAQFGALVEAAFNYAVGQRATDFYIKVRKCELVLMTPLGYFPVVPDVHWIIGDWKESSQENWVLAHKRSPHYWRDLIHPTPVVPRVGEASSPEA